MEWSVLNINKASVVKKEVDVILRALQNFKDESNPNISFLIDSIKSRIDDLEKFHSTHDDDDRSMLFEKQRLRLRQAIQSINTSTPNGFPSRSFSINPQVSDSSSSFVGVEREKLSTRDLTFKPKSPTNNFNKDTGSVSLSKSSRNSISVNPHSFSGSGMKLPTMKQPIYAWETASKGNEMMRVLIDGHSFVPSTSPGIYIQEAQAIDPSSSSSDNEMWIDVQIILTPEEMATLAARKKAMKKGSEKAGFMSNIHRGGSIQSSTPYVDQRRIFKNYFRPTEKAKWQMKSVF